jgi:hypothetical protein
MITCTHLDTVTVHERAESSSAARDGRSCRDGLRTTTECLMKG